MFVITSSICRELPRIPAVSTLEFEPSAPSFSATTPVRNLPPEKNSNCATKRFHRVKRRIAPPGFEPGTPAPKAGMLPLHHGAAYVINPPAKQSQWLALNRYDETRVVQRAAAGRLTEGYDWKPHGQDRYSGMILIGPNTQGQYWKYPPSIKGLSNGGRFFIQSIS